MEKRETDPEVYPDFYRCPFLGLIGKERSRVGCLLHPLSDGNMGTDFRGLSFYGTMACHGYFCPAYQHLSTGQKKIVASACADWYLYGLVVTDCHFLEAMFSEIERHLNRTIDIEEVDKNPGVSKALGALFQLKADWPYRKPGGKGPGNYFFNDATYPPAPIQYEKLGCVPSRYHAVFLVLGSEFESLEALRRAEETLERLVLNLKVNVEIFDNKKPLL